MSRDLLILGAVGLAVLAGGILLLRGTASVTTRETPIPAEVATLDASLEQLIADFNAAKGSVRMVFIAGPSCGPCLRGLDDMNRAVGDMTRSDPRLKAFIIYVPTLGAKEHHAVRAARIMAGPDIRHYWDAPGESGLAFQKALGLDVYAWDVWMIYGRDAMWTDRTPPAPVYWEHQLSGVPSGNRLDPEQFANKVAALLKMENGGG